MKKQLLAVAALALVSGAAVAQNATVYGIIDTGVYTTNNAGTAAATGGTSQTAMVSGTWLPSLFGITGSEDLGSGLKANFNLQSNLGSVNGTAGSASQVLFDRYATVGVSGAFGKVDLGRQIDIIFLQSFLNGVIPTHTNSLAVNGLLAGGAGTNANTATSSAFVNNAVYYATPEINGLKGQVQYAVGGLAGSTSANTVTAGLLTYAANGLSLSAGLEQQNGATGNSALKKALYGAKYTVGQIDLAAQYNTYKQDASTVGSNAKVDLSGYEIGAAYHVSPAVLVGVNYERFTNNTNSTNPTIVSLKAKYDLSKRTAVWGLVSSYNSTAAQQMPQGYNATTVTTGSGGATGFGVGVTHQF